MRLQRIVWNLRDQHDAWLIEYRDRDGYRCAVVRTCGYKMAKIAARELDGEIIGHVVEKIYAGPDDEEFVC